MRIVIDTNLWISALISKSLHKRIGQIVSNQDITILGSSTLLEEVKAVSQRPKIQKYTNIEQVSNLLHLLSNRVELLIPVSNIEICRDPNDNFLIALCLDGNADFLLSGDKDLLVLHSYQGVQILSISDFEVLLKY